MALPTGPIPRVAYDEIIEENWGDSVAQSLNNLTEGTDFIDWTPTAEMLATTSTTTWTQWFRVGGASADITVPDWAHHVIINLHISGIRATVSGNTTYLITVDVGPTRGRLMRQTNSVAPGGWFSYQWNDHIPCSSIEGDRGVKVMAMKVSGNQWAVDTDSRVFLQMTFLGAIDWYPGI